MSMEVEAVMKRSLKVAVLMSSLLVCAFACGQSLGEAARAAKTEKKSAAKKVITNDDISTVKLPVDQTEKPAETLVAADTKDAKEGKSAKGDDKETDNS